MQIAFSILPSNMQARKEPISTFLRLLVQNSKFDISKTEKKERFDFFLVQKQSREEDVSAICGITFSSSKSFAINLN